MELGRKVAVNLGGSGESMEEVNMIQAYCMHMYIKLSVN